MNVVLEATGSTLTNKSIDLGNNTIFLQNLVICCIDDSFVAGHTNFNK